MTTRAQAEAELIGRLGAWMTAADLDGTTVNGTNADLDSPIAYALRVVGESAVTDVVADDLDKFYDTAELRLLINIYQNYTAVDGKAGPVEGKDDQLAQRMLRAIAEKRGQIGADYGLGGGSAFSVLPTRTDGYSELAAL